MKRIQAKKHKIGNMKLIKYLDHALMIKENYQMMEFILQLILIKIASQVAKKLQMVVPIKKN